MNQNLSRLSVMGALASVVVACCGATFPDLDVVRLGGRDLSQSPQDIAVVGALAYVGGRQSEAGRFDILDVSDALNPRLLGSQTTSNAVESLTIEEGWAYLACGPGGVAVLDVRDPTQPREVGRCDTAGSATGVAVANRMAYVADGEAGLQVINLSDPSHPTWLGGYDTPGSAQAVAAGDGYAYVADDREGLQVIDVRNPAAPQKIGVLDTRGRCVGVCLSGEIAYIFDVDWLEPGPMGAWGPEELVAAGEGFVVVTVHQAHAPDVVGRLPGVGKFSLGHLRGIPHATVTDHVAYVADAGSGLKVVDLSDPINPRRIGGYGPTRAVMGADVNEGLAYVLESASAGSSGRLQVLTVNRTAQPRRLGVFAMDWEARNVTVDDGVAYVGTGAQSCLYHLGGAVCGILNQKRLEIVDVSEPGRPVLRGRFEAQVNELEIVGQRAFTAESYKFVVGGVGGVGERGQVGILDVSNPAVPQRLNRFSEPKGVQSIEVRDGIAYAAVGPPGQVSPEKGSLQVITLDPSGPRLLGEHATLERGWSLTLVDEVIYLVSASEWGGDGYLEIFDVGDPANPTPLGHCNAASGARAVSVSGPFAYVAAGPGGLQIMDVSNHAAPRVVAVYEAGAGVQDVAVAGTLAWLAVGHGGLEVVGLEDPLRPRRLGGNSAFDAWRLEVAEGSLYIAGGVDGLHILEAILRVRLGPVQLDAQGVLRLAVSGPPELETRIQRSPNLLDWDDWKVVRLADGAVVLEDAEAGDVPHRFYRAVGQ